MKLVNFETFNRMPAGTIFAPYNPCVMEDCMSIKVDEGETEQDSEHSHYFNGVMPLDPWLGETALFHDGDQEPATFEIYDGSSSDYSNFKLFLILENEDVDKLIRVLQWAQNGCKGEI